MAASAPAIFAMPHWSAIDDDNGVDDEEGDSEGEDEDSISGEELGAMLGEMLAGFVTSPDFDKGFRYSGKVLSHHQLEEMNEKLRRRLASTLVNVTNPRRYSSGGLLDNDFVCMRVQDKINELGEETDKLCDSCANAKRGDSALTEHTELMQHRVNQLLSWLEWLKMPTPPPTSAGCGMAGCSCAHTCPHRGLPLPEGAPAAMKQAFRAAAEGCPPPAAATEDEEGSVDSDQRWQAADDAMSQLLKEEEESKRKMQEKSNVAKQKKQKKKAKKKGVPAAAGVKEAANVAADAHNDVEEDPPDVPPASASIIDAHGQLHTNMSAFPKPGKADISEHVLVMVSPYQALEVLGDEEEAAPIEGLMQVRTQKTGKKSGRTLGPAAQAVAAAAAAKPQHSAAGSSSAAQQHSSRPAGGERRAPQDADHHEVAQCKHGHSDAAEAELSDKQVQQMHSKFMKLVKRKGKWDHTWLVNCLNPVTAQHDPEVRSAYKQLPKLAQQAVWRSMPSGSQSKPPVSHVGARGVRGKPAQAEAASTAPPVARTAPQHPQQAAVWAAGDCSTESTNFLQFLKSRGIHFHSGLTTALNLSAPAYDSAVRTAYKSLPRPDQAAVWRLLPKESPDKPHSTAAHAHAWQEAMTPAAQQGAREAPGMQMPGLGVRPAMSRLGCRPGGQPGPSLVPMAAPGTSSSFYAPGLGAAAGVSADRFASSLTPDLGGLSWNVQEPSASAQTGDVNDEEEAKLCVVCLDKRCDALLLPCKHAVMCVSCALLVKNSTGECPYCRQSIDTVMCVH